MYEMKKEAGGKNNPASYSQEKGIILLLDDLIRGAAY